MLLGVLGTSLLKNISAGKSAIRAAKGTIRAASGFYSWFFFQLILKYKDIIMININLMMFIQEKISLK